MKKIFKTGIVLMTVLMMVGTVWAYDEDEHVSQALNGKGDVLIFPQYLAFPGGWNTRMTIINTCTSKSVVAKLIVRSGGYTEELLDFFIFLSPTDVWSGDINYGPTGPRIISYDDSVIRNEQLQFADADNPFTADFQDVCASDVINWNMPGDQVGYVTVIEAWEFGGVWNGTDFGSPGVNKTKIMEAFFTDTNFGTYSGGTPTRLTNVFEETANVLAAHYEISYPAGNLYAANQATILQNFNVNTAITIGFETRMDGDSSRNSLCEVEAALAKSRVEMPYYAGTSGIATITWMTFPTKYTQAPKPDCTINGVLSPFFTQNTTDPYRLEYGLKWYDMSEHSPTTSSFTSPVADADQYYLPYEVNIVEKIMSISYDQGWANLEFADNTGTYTTNCNTDEDPLDPNSEIQFYGAPVIPTTMFIAGNQMGMMKGAWSNGWVYVDETDGIEDTTVAATYNPLYQVDWTAFGYYDINADGTVDDPRGTFCEATPVIPDPLP